MARKVQLLANLKIIDLVSRHFKVVGMLKINEIHNLAKSYFSSIGYLFQYAVSLPIDGALINASFKHVVLTIVEL